MQRVLQAPHKAFFCNLNVVYNKLFILLD